MTKALLVIVDGMGDRPVAEFDGRTPLEAAVTPTMDRLAREGISGLMHTLGVGKVPGSDTAHLVLLGYDPALYYHGRGPFEAAGIGMDLRPGDVAFRGNVACVDEQSVVTDRRGGRISDTTPYVNALGGKVDIEDISFILKPGTGYRVGVIMRGPGISAEISSPDPKIAGEKVKKVKGLDGSPEAEKSARVINAFLAKVHETLGGVSENKQRIAEGKAPINYLLIRGAGTVHSVPKFQERFGMRPACVAGAGLYKGVAKVVGFDIMEVPGATGQPNTSIVAKVEAVKKAFAAGYDFVFMHIKSPDSFAEDGNAKGKKEFLERMDRELAGLLELKDTVIALTGDHSTACSQKAHTGDPVPILFWGPDVRVDSVAAFGERTCMLGGLGHIQGKEVIEEILNLTGHQKKIGA